MDPNLKSHLTFEDNFDYLDASPYGETGWMTSYPFGGDSTRTLPRNFEVEQYNDNLVNNGPFIDDGGILTIRAQQSTAPGTLPYVSGLINTYKSFSQLYGYFEVRAKLPNGPGAWPAFWLLPADDINTSEIDVFEMLGNDPTTIYSTVHGSTNGESTSLLQRLSVSDTSLGFHTYGVDWEPDIVRFYMDDILIASASTPGTMSKPMYMLLNLAVGGLGSWPGPVDPSQTGPFDMKIDYVRAYATPNTKDISGTRATSSDISGPATAIIGSGPDHVTVTVSQDPFQGDAQFLIAIDGQPFGGTLTTSARHDMGQKQSFVFQGSFGAVPHTVTVSFLNPTDGGTPALRRNLYVEAVSDGYQSVAVGNEIRDSSPKDFSLPARPAGLILNVSEDAWMGDAMFSVSVDGSVIGAAYTAVALKGNGATQQVVVGQLAAGPHLVGVTFLNDSYGGNEKADRNLYLENASYDGAAVIGSNKSLFVNGTATFAVGNSYDNTGLIINVSEDAWQGDAEFTIGLDGNQVGGIFTATASHAAGQSNAIPVTPTLSSGLHQISITFINDAYGGSSSVDRNLYVINATYNGGIIPGSSMMLATNSTASFSEGGPVYSNIELDVSEDEYFGDAQFVAAVDGKPTGVIYSVSASHALGESQKIFVNNIVENMEPHDVAISFINDKWGGAPGSDRNLYVDTLRFDSEIISGSTVAMYSASTIHFTAHAPLNWAGPKI